MPPALRSTTTPLCALLLAFAPGCVESECPGAGSPLGLGSPLVEYQWTTGGCYDAESWVGQVDAVEATWTIDVDRTPAPSSAVMVSEAGPAVLRSNDLVIFDAEGRRLAERIAVGPSFQSAYATTASGHTVAVALTGGTPQYRVFDRSGKQVWLRLLSAEAGQTSSFPGLALDAEGKLWVGLQVFGNEDFEVELQRWEVTGNKLETLHLPGKSSTWFVVDGEGRFALVDDRLTLFDAQGVEIGEAQGLDDFWITSLAALPDGFVIGGARNDHPAIVRIDGAGNEVWTTSLASNAEWGQVFGLAASPGGGVVVAGSEHRISVRYPDSPLIFDEQPFVVALDADGGLQWGERIAASGASLSVGVGPDGSVYATGYAQGDAPDEYGYVDYVIWLRRYDP